MRHLLGEMTRSERRHVTQQDSARLCKTELSIQIRAVLQHEAAFVRGGHSAEQIAMCLQGIVVAQAVYRSLCTPHVEVGRGKGERVVEMINRADLGGI